MGNTWPLLWERKRIILEANHEHLDSAACQPCFWRQAEKMHPRLSRKTKVWGEEQKSSFSITDLMCSRHLVARKTEKGHLGAFSKARATCSPVPAPWRGARALLGDFSFPPPQFSQGECKKGYTKQISSGWTCLLNPGQLQAEKGMQYSQQSRRQRP